MFDKRKDNNLRSGDPLGAAVESVRRPSDAAPAMPSPHRAPAVTATIGATIVVKGDVYGDEDVVIAGEFEGSIDLPNHALTVTEGGRVKADIKANVVKIQGEVHGDVDGVDKVLITPTGRMQGNITSPRVILDDGAKFKGSIDMNPAQQQPKKAAAPRPTPGPTTPPKPGPATIRQTPASRSDAAP